MLAAEALVELVLGAAADADTAALFAGLSSPLCLAEALSMHGAPAPDEFVGVCRRNDVAVRLNAGECIRIEAVVPAHPAVETCLRAAFFFPN